MGRSTWVCIALVAALSGCDSSNPADVETPDPNSRPVIEHLEITPEDLPDDLDLSRVYFLMTGDRSRPAALLIDLWAAGLRPVRAWHPLDNLCADILGPRFTVELERPDPRILELGFNSGTSPLSCSPRLVQFTVRSVKALPDSDIRLGLDLSATEGDPENPIAVEATIVNAGGVTVFYGGEVCLPGVRLAVEDPDGETHPLGPPTLVGCPSMNNNPFYPAETQFSPREFNGFLWSSQTGGPQEIAPGDYTIIAQFAYHEQESETGDADLLIEVRRTIVWDAVSASRSSPP